MAGMVVREHRVVEAYTVDDLDAMPDDGVQRELLDGLLLVTPSPILIHQAVVGELYLALRRACPDHLKVFFAPLDWRPDRLTSLQPDLLVLPRDRLEVTNVTLPDLELAVEVLSPSTRTKDLLLKRERYERAGVRAYWLVDPGPRNPSVLALDLVDGGYVEAGRAVGDQRLSLTRPFEITLVPADLARL